MLHRTETELQNWVIFPCEFNATSNIFYLSSYNLFIYSSEVFFCSLTDSWILCRPPLGIVLPATYVDHVKYLELIIGWSSQLVRPIEPRAERFCRLTADPSWLQLQCKNAHSSVSYKIISEHIWRLTEWKSDLLIHLLRCFHYWRMKNIQTKRECFLMKPSWNRRSLWQEYWQGHFPFSLIAHLNCCVIC